MPNHKKCVPVEHIIYPPVVWRWLVSLISHVPEVSGW